MSDFFVVVRGGTHTEKDLSKDYGQRVLEILKKINSSTKDLYLHPNGVFTLDGFPINIEEEFSKFKFLWNALIGTDGENGLVSTLCEKHKVPFVGHSTIHSHLAHNKHNFKKAVKSHGLKSPYGVVVDSSKKDEDAAQLAFRTVGIPSIVKPLSGSGVKEIGVAMSFGDLQNLIEKAFENNSHVMIEKLEKGVSGSAFVYKVYDIYNVHISPHTHDHHAKNLIAENFISLRNQFLKLHHNLAFNDHVEYDFIFDGKRLSIIEANTHPSLTHGYLKHVFLDGDEEQVSSLENYIRFKLKEKKLI